MYVSEVLCDRYIENFLETKHDLRLSKGRNLKNQTLILYNFIKTNLNYERDH